jgi:hypothetical protein
MHTSISNLEPSEVADEVNITYYYLFVTISVSRVIPPLATRMHTAYCSVSLLHVVSILVHL